MKRIFSALALVAVLAGSAFALSDAEYLRLKKSNADFARADKALTQTWNSLKKSMPKSRFKILQEEQREWIEYLRDSVAEDYMKDGYSRAEAYTIATNERIDELKARAKELTK